MALRIKPDLLAGVYDLNEQRTREDFMFEKITKSIHEHKNVLAVVGYIHLVPLARMFEAERISLSALIFTYPLVVDETKS